MEKRMKPDRKYITKGIWTSIISSSSTFLMLGGFAHLIAYTEGSDTGVIQLIWLLATALTLLIWAISIPWVLLWVRNLEYMIQDDRVTIHKGILTKTQKNIPLRAITDFILQRTLLDRILGIGTIKIQTAGQSASSGGYEGKLAGLLAYQSLHSDLRQMIGKLHPVSESIITKESGISDTDSLLRQILVELKEINKNTGAVRKSQ